MPSAALLERPSPVAAQRSSPPGWNSGAFLEWLYAVMADHRMGTNVSQLATYSGLKYGTISAWIHRGARPSYDSLVRLATALGIPQDEALRAAAYEVVTQPAPPVEVPDWLVRVINKLDESELATLRYAVEGTAQGLLRLREERAKHGAELPPRPESPPARRRPTQEGQGE